MTAWSKGKGLGPHARTAGYTPNLLQPHQTPWDRIRTHPNTKKQINKKYILTLSSKGAGARGPGCGKKEEQDLVL